MSPRAQKYREVLVIAVTGHRPTGCFVAADEAKLCALAEQLARDERIAEMLWHNGHCKPGDPIDETIGALLSAGKA